jgi:G protein-coupled receptor Mth (Methuselah protein)
VLVSSLNRVYNISIAGINLQFYAEPYPHEAYEFVHTDTCIARSVFYEHNSALSRDLNMYQVNTLLTCTQIELIPNEFDILDDTAELLIKMLNITLYEYEYKLQKNGTGARICLHNYAMANDSLTNHIPLDVGDGLAHALYLFTFICTCISLLCLVVTFLTYCVHSELRTLPEENIMCLVFSHFCVQGIMQFGQSQTTNGAICILIGALDHYFWLATFCCMSVCSFHMFRVFAIKIVSPSFVRSNEGKMLFLYCIYAFGLPAVIVACTVGINAFIHKGHNFGYGGNTCFLSDTYSLVLGFGLPVGLIIATNAVYFVATACKIGRTSSVRSSNTRERRNVIVFAKLFTLTGATWVVVIVDALYTVLVMSFIATFLVGCQGVFICYAFLCNKRVYILYRNRFRGVIPSRHPVPRTATIELQPTSSSGMSASTTRADGSIQSTSGMSVSTTDADGSIQSTSAELECKPGCTRL